MERDSYSQGFQKVVVRLLLQDPSFLDSMADNLSPSFFENAIHRWFVRKLFYVRQTFGSRVTRTSLEVELNKDLAAKTLVEEEAPKYVAFLDRLEKPVHDAPYVKEEIFSFIKRAKQRTAMLKASELWVERRPTSEIDAAFLSAVTFMPKDAEQATFIGPDLKARIKRRMRPVSAIETGFDGLDSQFDHRGIPQKFSGCIIAPPGRGKTLWLVVLGAAALRAKFKVLHYTLELPKDMILDRYDAAMSGIPLSKLKRKPKTLTKMWRDLGDIGNNLVVREEPPGLTVNGIRGHLRELESMGFVPDLLVIDYADEMAPAATGGRDDGSYEKQGQIYIEINQLIKEKNIACWTAAQARRDSLAKRTLDLSDIGDSWNKAKKAFVVWALCQTPEERKKHCMRIVMLKNRDGFTGKEIGFSVDTARIQVKEDPSVTESNAKEVKRRKKPPAKEGKYAQHLKSAA